MAEFIFKDVWEMYRIKFLINKKKILENFWALRGVSFEVGNGESLGIIGENGAGKSTVLKLIAGILKPDRGEVNVKGKVTGLLELGAGFQGALSGRDNVYLSSSLFGLSEKQTEEKIDGIIGFADIGRFIDAPVECYSQGMFVRLAFAIAINMDPDILLIDDTLAVGDTFFQKKCLKKVIELKDDGKAVIFVNHDMNMLKRLCDRAIFLKDGRIIVDSFADRAVSLYTQTIGQRQGVGILGMKALKIVFNNGKISIVWQDALLTSDAGGFTSFFLDEKWFSSVQAEWSVEKKGDNKIVATGKFFQLDVVQVWSIELTDDHEFIWSIEVDSSSKTLIQEAHTNIALTSKYLNWFTAFEKGSFPLIEEADKGWNPLLEDKILRKCIGVKAADADKDKIPSLILESPSCRSPFKSQIYNSDYMQNSRVLQFRTFNLQNYAANMAASVNYFSGKISFGVLDVEGYLKKSQDDFVLYSGKSKLVFDNGRAILSYGDISITEANHIASYFYANGIWHDSSLFIWEVKKNGDTLLASGGSLNVPVLQTWRIGIAGQGIFSLEINFEAKENIEIQHFRVLFNCPDGYTHWFSDYGRGEFPKGFLEAELDITQKCIPDGEIGIKDSSNILPELGLSFSKGVGIFSKIFNRDFYHRVRMLTVELVKPEGKVLFSKGEQQRLMTQVRLGGDLEAAKVNAFPNDLEVGKLRFDFNGGASRIYWEGVEITKKFGLYVSLRSKGRWHDSSSSAIWKMQSGSSDQITAFGRWTNLPVSQCWKISLKESSKIEFSIVMTVEESIEVDRLQANIMLSEKYKDWSCGAQRGFFPEFNSAIDDDWEVLCSSAVTSKRKGIIGVLDYQEGSVILPAVAFLPNQDCPAGVLNVVNSDLCHRGRVLQYLDRGKKILSPGERLFFRGGIVINSKLNTAEL